MSRLGKLPVELNAGTQAKIEKGFIIVKGPKGELKQKMHELVDIQISEKEILVDVKNKKSKDERALWGLYRSLVFNMVAGVNTGFEKKLEVNGVGYRVALAGNKLNLTLGFSHPVEYVLPEGISGLVEANVITIKGIDKQLVGEVAANIRKIKKPEPYKGKGIKYIDEVIRRKEGKTAAK
ncbi:MAG: 50S ribosomal protein L6 [Candidatus Falkowbacteria bacterium GW2011_GWC2_38_22]|uniref:Large ribosomal subunit protein uL6 n=1 Tax=Candidatus Falkowbacteria bacterium GW2011_GWE1_38_31 TaxID=1618638 RepID=A0A0G0JTN4_9BACT|nr:MAG: 50S ribosomal protein L6 [Candidatus Falkowbacteria bacterium GW2011_GWC2_38_22]KKQ63315.1 MAG: 50S ribosomal protein L6 [Candidatus Falkowbacteria bacterium GW2011_GWF1_38_22]KKQ65567.1 MAG: 50S ribosomal protein L6 [Candidatus Falkowbacteria bacterium GW2011_GWE2_38_254]KKQ70047.1 MAG: 50S ribosomal protein L6 [Candidatus Falkowbacteria bacterium GW2011_GWE1_38_31]KKQ72712.1 MAG: 50S ribosomal protein L6 [Candidatus Falkowbacteria bacterium GW2011_GWD2_38_42]HAM88174.1 50S ribosomal 